MILRTFPYLPPWLFVLLVVTACTPSLETNLEPTPAQARRTLDPSATQARTSLASLRPSQTPTLTPLPRVGPAFRRGFNPLTGLPLADPGTMAMRPLLIAITNFPPSARPQAGVSAAAQVWETSIGEGMTRFLAVYYGDFRSELETRQGLRPLSERIPFVIGPVRSGRIAFEDIKTFYPGAFLLTHSASSQVREQLTNRIGVASDDPNDVNSAVLTLEELSEVAILGAHPEVYAGLVFDTRKPAGGGSGASLDIVYNLYNHVRWDYDPPRGSYLRSQNTVEETDSLIPSQELLDGTPWSFENVVVLFAQHRFVNPEGTILDIELLYVPERFGILFRDGRRYEVEWSSRAGELQLRTRQGEILPLKPGRTFFEVVTFQSTWDAAGRLVRFHIPPPPTATPVPSPTPTRTPLPPSPTSEP